MPVEMAHADTVDMNMLMAWKDFIHTVNPYLKITGEICMKNIARTVMAKINAYVNEENIFTLNDEAIFGYYDEIMRKYSETIKLYRNNRSDIKELRITEILDGVSDILFAQLNQYEEHTGRAPGKLGKAFNNPIGAEKERILSAVYKKVLGALDLASENIFSEGGYFELGELTGFCFECADRSVNESHIDLFTFMYQRVIEKGGLEIYKSYSGALTECARDINSLDLRKETRYFFDALKQEKENLSSIIKIQLSPLSEYCGENSRERAIVENINASLTGAYAALKERTRELDEIFAESDAVKKPILMNYDDFLFYIEERGLCAYADKLRAEGLESGTLSAVQKWKEKLDLFLKSFSAFLSEFMSAEADSKPFKLFIYEMRKRIADKLILTEEMLRAFRELKGFYEQNEERLKKGVAEDAFKIINGINESIAIKIDTLEEAVKSFASEAEQKLNSFTPPDFTDTDKKELFKRRLCLWGEEMRGIDAYAVNYAEEARNKLQFAINSLERTTAADEYSLRAERQMQKETDEITKLESSYLKNSALFEIVTFEEILAYSVSKLKEYEGESAAEYAERCDALEEMLVKLCKLHNIAIISPEPFDFFNSSEHEVLVAERNDGYKKGQIIKRMNSGFKYNDVVLVRANVIAAK